MGCDAETLIATMRQALLHAKRCGYSSDLLDAALADVTISDIPTRSDGNTKALDDALQEIHTAAAIVLSSDRLVHLNTLHQRELESIPRRVHDAGCAARALAIERERDEAREELRALRETINGR